MYEFDTELPVMRATRVHLRPLAEPDLPALFEVFSDPEVMRYWSTPRLVDMRDAAALLEDIRRGFQERRFFQWGIEYDVERAVIGTCTLFNWDARHGRAELGFALARRVWNRGLALEAVDRVVRFGFEDLGLHRLEADADPRNAASLRVLRRLGFQVEGLLRERYRQEGEMQDAVLLGLLRTEWLPLPGPGPVDRGMNGLRS